MHTTAPRPPIAEVLWSSLDDREDPMADTLTAELADALDAVLGACLDNRFLRPLDNVLTLEFALCLDQDPKQAWVVYGEGQRPNGGWHKTVVAWSSIVEDADGVAVWHHPMWEPITQAVSQAIDRVRTLGMWEYVSLSTFCVRMRTSDVTAHQRLALGEVQRRLRDSVQPRLRPGLTAYGWTPPSPTPPQRRFP